MSAPLPPDAELSGRGLISGDEILLPTRQGLSRYRVDNGKRRDVRWDAEGGGGNMLALPDSLIVAGSDGVATYVRKEKIWKSLRDRMASSPDDALPAVELAEVALGAAEYSDSLAALGEAMTRFGRAAEGDERLRRRLFAVVQKSATTLSRKGTLEAKDLDPLYGCAARLAWDEESNVAHRFGFAELFEQIGQPDRAIRLCQQVLRDRSLRAFSRQAAELPPRTAGTEAQSRIAALITRHGRSAYAEHDMEAKRLLEAGRTAHDALLFRRVIEVFPNSESAPPALIELGDELSRSGKLLEAALHYTRAYHRYADRVDRPGLIHKIADAHERAGRPEHAYRWLTKGAGEFPSIKIKVDGKPRTFLEHRRRLDAVRERVEQTRPTLHLPLKPTAVRELPEGAALLSPRFDSDPTQRWRFGYLATSKELRQIDPRTGADVWTEPVRTREEPELLVARADLAVFATEHELFAVDVVTAQRRWSHGAVPPHVGDPGGDWEEGGAFRAHGLQGDLLVSARDNGEMICVNVATGQLVWKQTKRPAPFGRLRVLDPWVVYHVVQDGRAIIAAVYLADGTGMDAVMTDETRPIEDLFVTIDGTALLISTQSVSAYDLDTHERRWVVSTSGHLRPGSLVLDLDALYFSDNGYTLRKVDIEDGRELRESERLAQRGADEFAVEQVGAQLIAQSSGGVTSVDSTTGMTLWEATLPDRPRLIAGLVSDTYVVAVDKGDRDDEGVAAYFFDHRNASGLISKEGGKLLIGPLDAVQHLLAADGAILVQAGSKLHVFSEP